MSKYAIVQIHQEGIYAASTLPEMLDWIQEQVTSEVPEGKVDRRDQFHLEIERLKGRDKELAWQIMQKLCALGWEPFSVISQGEYNIMGNVYFRKELAD
jgi:hypothetical protein